MQCTKPMWLEFWKLYVPCGKCGPCRVARTREWSLRLEHELEDHKDAVFCTLTYSAAHLPDDNSLSKSDLQRFIKRLRKALEPRKLRYFAAGEYGETFGRPHYHACIYGISFGEHETFWNGKCHIATTGPLVEAWSKGAIQVGTVTHDSAQYVSGYIQKDTRSSAYDGRTAPFALQSKGLGRAYADRNRSRIVDHGITQGGKYVGVPRYYKKRLDLDPASFVERADEARKVALAMVQARLTPRRGEHAHAYGERVYRDFLQQRRQVERNLEAKNKLYGEKAEAKGRIGL